MAIKIYEQFAPFANPADGDYPLGSFKNDSIPGAEDGTPLDAVWANDYAGTDAELFAQAGIVPNGQPDKLGASQRVDALRKMFTSLGTVADITAGKFKVGDLVGVTDRVDAPFNIVAIGAYVVNGFNILDAGSGRVAVLDVKGVANVMHFGAKGIGNSFDDAPAIQAAINYAHSIGGGAVYFPKPVNYYALKTTSTTTTGKLACLIVPAPTAFYGDPISLISDSPLNPIRVETPLSTTFAGVYFEGFSLYKQMVNLDIWGGVSPTSPLCDHVVYGADDYHANMMITGCRFYVAVEDCLRLATYVTTMTNVQTAYAKRGFKLAGPDEVNDVVTSLTLNSCYGLECSENAFWFGNTTYCTLNSCASDHIGQFPYRFGIARATTMNACGAESSPRILKAITAQGLQINGIYTLSIGDNLTPPMSLIEIDGGSSVTLSGLHLQNPLAYGKKISLGSVFAKESVTILDSSVTPAEVSFIPNYTHSNPFKFVVWGKSTRDFTWAITDMNSLLSVLESFNNTSQDHVQILQFPDGDFTLTSAIFTLATRVNGGGSIVFKGGVNSRIVVSGANQFSFGNTPATLNIVFENIDLHMLSLSGISQGFVFYGRNTRFKNSKITSFNGYVQYAIGSSANLFFDSNSESLTVPFTLGGEYTVRLQPRPTIPTGYHANGAIAYKDVPDAATKGWISGAGVWFAF